MQMTWAKNSISNEPNVWILTQKIEQIAEIREEIETDDLNKGKMIRISMFTIVRMFEWTPTISSSTESHWCERHLDFKCGNFLVTEIFG